MDNMSEYTEDLAHLSPGAFVEGRRAGYNVDDLNVDSGVEFAKALGYTSPMEAMVVAHCLNLHRRGEEANAQKMFLRQLGNNNLTSWYMILATAMAGVE